MEAADITNAMEILTHRVEPSSEWHCRHTGDGVKSLDFWKWGIMAADAAALPIFRYSIGANVCCSFYVLVFFEIFCHKLTISGELKVIEKVIGKGRETVTRTPPKSNMIQVSFLIAWWLKFVTYAPHITNYIHSSFRQFFAKRLNMCSHGFVACFHKIIFPNVWV